MAKEFRRKANQYVTKYYNDPKDRALPSKFAIFTQIKKIQEAMEDILINWKFLNEVFLLINRTWTNEDRQLYEMKANTKFLSVYTAVLVNDFQNKKQNYLSQMYTLKMLRENKTKTKI